LEGQEQLLGQHQVVLLVQKRGRVSERVQELKLAQLLRVQVLPRRQPFRLLLSQVLT
jgi:hypothetical protein